VRPCLLISGVNREITAVINVRFEVVLAPVVERVGKQEAAGTTTAIIDRRAREREFDAIGDCAVPVEVD